MSDGRTLAKAAVQLKAASRQKGRLPSLWLMTDAQRLPDPLPAIRRLPRGSGVIVRHTDTATRRQLAERIVPLCRCLGLVCLIAGDWRLAAATRADGVHLPERAATFGLAAPAALWRRTSARVLTIAAHSGRALHRATRLKPDAVVLARVFASASHPGEATLGPLGFAVLTRSSRVPVIALGGLTAARVKRLIGSDAVGIAAIGALS